MIQGHQFNKVEMVQYTTPEGSDDAFTELVRKRNSWSQAAGLHFRTVKLAAGDCSASMARTYDIEIYIPSMEGFKEVSSASNARDYQARRGQIRYRRAGQRENRACPHPERIGNLQHRGFYPPLSKQNQQKDGSVVVPEVLRKYMGGIEVIK